jgi:hypothetical protein
MNYENSNMNNDDDNNNSINNKCSNMNNNDDNMNNCDINMHINNNNILYIKIMKMIICILYNNMPIMFRLKSDGQGVNDID